MSKIFEALEHARAERKAMKPELVATMVGPAAVPLSAQQAHAHAPPSPRPGPKIQPFPFQPPEATFEREMAAIYHPIVSAMPNGKGMVLFLGTNDEDGTSTMAREFASFVSAHVGSTSLLFDADRQKPSQLAHFGIRGATDIEAVVHDGRGIDEAIYPVRNTGLQVTSLALRPTNRPFVFGSPRTDHVLNQLRQRFDIVVIDAPAPTGAPDMLALTAKVDGVVLVIRADQTRFHQAKRTKELIEANGGKLIGLVFNKRRFFIPDWIYKRL
jgi:Mrp family chromosome partitioning ATPase